MSFFPNFAAQHSPRFPQRFFQRPSSVVQRYRAPELLGEALPPINVIETPGGPLTIWPTYWTPFMFQAQQGPKPVVVAPSTAVESPASTPATPSDQPAVVTPSTPVSTTPAAATSFVDEVSTWLNAQMISGVPNYWLAIAAAGGGLLLFRSKGARR